VVLGSQWNYMGMSLSGLIGAIGFLLLGSGLLALLQSQGSLAWSLSPATTAGFGCGIALVVIAASLAFSHTRRMLDTTTWLSHRQEVLAEIKELYATMSDLASRQRIYLIIGDERFLQPRQEMRPKAAKAFLNLRQLTSDNPAQQRRLAALEPLLAKRIEWEDQLINIRQTEGFSSAAQRMTTGVGRHFTDEIVQLLNEMEQEEYRLLAQHRREAETASTTAFSILPLGVFLSLAILSLSLSFLNAGATEQKQAENALRASEGRYRTLFESNPNPMWVYDQETLSFLAVNDAASRHYGFTKDEFFAMTIREIRPPEDIPALMDNLSHTSEELDETTGWRHRKKSGELIDVAITSHQMMWLGRRARLVLINDVTARKRAERDLQELNAELENRVERRTAELETANKELEAFSYSVSHDLRSPLRTVDGFSQAVLEDYGHQLPDEGRRYLQTIRDGAQRMGVLIDDLLTFSRLSRMPLNRQKVDTARIVRDVLEELGAGKQGDNLELKIGELSPVYGDPALLKQVWVNLISNALKYSRNRETAVIEIGQRQERDETVFFVSDNGTGFDMQYAHKLFGVFQRLHRTDEFEGTGVGLAIVQRVISRHGGRVWAEAAPDRGATFSFTLDKGSNKT
jgi:PAS domain S-box-containing protein